MRNRTKAIITIAIVVALVAAASYRIYFIRENSGGDVLWNANEAYFFIEISRDGLHVSGLGYPWFIFKQYLGGFAAVKLPDDERASLVVIRVTSSGIEQHVLQLDRTAKGGPGTDPGKYTPLENRIYAYCPWVVRPILQDGHLIGGDPNDALCWWAVDHFEKATEEEKRRLGGIGGLTKTDFENDGNGWSRRGFGAGSIDRNFTIAVGDKFRLFMNNVVKGNEDSRVSIDVLRPGKAAERIGTFDARQGRISKAEYQGVFQEPAVRN